MRRTAAGLLLTLLLMSGCPAPDDSKPEPPPVPEELIGAWNMVTERGNAFSYEISARRVYVYVGIMQDKTQQYTTQESGGFAVQDNRITFTPASITVTRSDSSAPADNFQRTTTAPPRTLDWSVNGNDLTLTADGQSSEYVRE